jgi:hypothetical protein
MPIRLILTCWLPFLGLWIALLKSPLIPHLLESFVTYTPMTEVDVLNYLSDKNRWTLMSLYSCIWCQAFWISVGAAATYGVATSQFIWIPIFALSYYPLSAWAVLKFSLASAPLGEQETSAQEDLTPAHPTPAPTEKTQAQKPIEIDESTKRDIKFFSASPCWFDGCEDLRVEHAKELEKLKSLNNGCDRCKGALVRKYLKLVKEAQENAATSPSN